MDRPPCTAPRDNLPGDRGCSHDSCPRHAYDALEPDDEEPMPECCTVNEDGYVLAHQHRDGTSIACAPTRCPGCTLCPRDED